MTEQTEQTIPAGPTTLRQRKYLSDLVKDVEELTRAITTIRNATDRELALLTSGTVPSATLGTNVFQAAAADVVALRARIEVRAQAVRAYGLTGDHIAYAIKVGSIETYAERTAVEAEWLFSQDLTE